MPNHDSSSTDDNLTTTTTTAGSSSSVVGGRTSTSNDKPSPQPIDRKKEKTLLGKVFTQQQSKSSSTTSQPYHSSIMKNLDSLQSFRKSTGSSSSAVMTINVGGVLYTTFKDTLSRKINGKDHLLSVMFSNEDHFEFSRDDQGHIFIDRNGKLFSYILDYLRCGGDVRQFALPLHNACLMEQLEIEFEFFNLYDLCLLLKGRRKTFKIEKKKYTKIKTKSGSELISADTSAQSNSTAVKSLEIISNTNQQEIGVTIGNEDEDTNDDTSSILLEENDESDDELLLFERKLEDDLFVVDHDSDSSQDDFDEDVIFIEPPTPDAVLTPSSEPATIADDEDSVSTFDAAIKSVNDETNLVIRHQSQQATSPSLHNHISQQHHEKHKLNLLSKKQKSSLFSSFHNIKHKICNEKGEPVIGYSEDASICYIYPNLSRYYYPIICKQPIQLRGVDRRLSKCYNYYEITINSDFEEKIDYVNYNIPGIVVAVMSNKNIKVLKQHHKKDLPIDLKKETVVSGMMIISLLFYSSIFLHLTYLTLIVNYTIDKF